MACCEGLLGSTLPKWKNLATWRQMSRWRRAPCGAERHSGSGEGRTQLKILRRAASEFLFFWDFFALFSRYSHHVRGRDAPWRFFPGDIVLQGGVDDFFFAPTFACEGLAVVCASDESKSSEVR